MIMRVSLLKACCFCLACDASGSLALRGPISQSSGAYAKMFKSFTNKSDESVGEALRDELACQFGKNLCVICACVSF